MKQKIIITAVVCAITAAVVVGIRLRSTPHVPAELKLSGVIEATTTELSFKVPGRMAKRLVDEGMQVTAGQEIARLDADELQQERSIRQADEKMSRAGLADLEAGSRREEIAQGEAVLARLQAEAVRFSQDAERTETLFKREVIPRKELEAVLAARDASASAVREASQRLKLLKSGPRPDSVRQAQARVEAAVSATKMAETRLSYAVLLSPVSGVVLAKHAEAGEMVATGTPIITVGNLDEVWVRGYIPENELGRVKLGQKAKVSLDSWPGRTFEGQVSFISPEAEFTPKNVQTEKERVKLVYRIKITLANPKRELKPGMPADAHIIKVDKTQ